MFGTFALAATLGRGSVPYLPEELRHLIWEWTFPRDLLWCSVCGVAVMQRACDGSVALVRTHQRLWWETPRCFACAGYPG